MAAFRLSPPSSPGLCSRSQPPASRLSPQCKCAQYWPDQGCWTYGNIRVSVEDVTVLVDYTVRKFCIQQVLHPPQPLPASLLGAGALCGLTPQHPRLPFQPELLQTCSPRVPGTPFPTEGRQQPGLAFSPQILPQSLSLSVPPQEPALPHEPRRNPAPCALLVLAFPIRHSLVPPSEAPAAFVTACFPRAPRGRRQSWRGGDQMPRWKPVETPSRAP